MIWPGVWIMSSSKYLADLDCSGEGREIGNMQPWITLQNQGVGWSVNIVRIPISREDFFDI
jgi:hypothetical protein